MIAYQALVASLNGRKFRQAGLNFLSGALSLARDVVSFGITRRMDEHEKRKLKIFNHLVFFQLIASCILPVASGFTNSLGPFNSIQGFLPVLISMIVLILNFYRRFIIARILYFLAYPFVTSILYMSGTDPGLELNFILYGILAVFFVQPIGHLLFSVTLSMVSYFVLAVLLKNYQYELEAANYGFYLFNQAVTIIFIFYGLFLIKRENSGYQQKLLVKTKMLHKKNIEILRQRKEIAQKAQLLEVQTVELKDLNAIKDRLFSVIAHDLRTPLYALKNLFQQMEEHNVSGDEIKTMMPEIMNDLNYTTELMDNLLLWTKSQMQSDKVKPRSLDASELADKVIRLLRLQARTKNIKVTNEISRDTIVMADRDMINMILRNLLSNAIKFTPPDGSIIIGAADHGPISEIYVKDTGKGISDEAMSHILRNEYYTTKGTSNETGTGLGLMLCKDFIIKNRGEMKIQSELGKGSVFGFTLPKAEHMKN